jgi:CheY-like chemotaxis protein
MDFGWVAYPKMETKDLRVLLADDDDINQLVACTFLRKWEIGATIAKDGNEALALVQRKGFHLIMMDLHMPGMDGAECTRRIREMKDPYFKNIPIILFSASGSIDSPEGARKLGMTDFMSKPFRQEELKAKLSLYLPLPVTKLRPLYIDFKVHTGDDPVFRLELLRLLVENLNELRRSVDLALTSGDILGFRSTSHKVASMFAIVNDKELDKAFVLVKHLMAAADLTAPALRQAVAGFERIANEVIRAMEHEIRTSQDPNPAQLRKR